MKVLLLMMCVLLVGVCDACGGGKPIYLISREDLEKEVEFLKEWGDMPALLQEKEYLLENYDNLEDTFVLKSLTAVVWCSGEEEHLPVKEDVPPVQEDPPRGEVS